MKPSRRDLLKGAGLASAALLLNSRATAAAETSALEQRSIPFAFNAGKINTVVSTYSTPWRAGPKVAEVDPKSLDMLDVNFYVELDNPKQTLEGFGGSFSELGWDALQKLSAVKQHDVMQSLFGEDDAAFSLCRTPLGASDFARGWYSYDETPGDFELKRFSVANDEATLIPYIRAARAVNPDLAIWASPWSPPTWMKTNGHYALAPAWPGRAGNGIRPEQTGSEGNDYFRLEARYLEAYANYFKRYIDAYQGHGIPISLVMPQNEFNSPQPFPSCCWTPEGLAQFIPYLGRALESTGVDIMLGTLERGDPSLVARVIADTNASQYLSGVGVQWQGKHALPYLQRDFPELRLWGTEQECGDGTNDWHYARYAWGLMKRYLQFGASAYMYWNMILPEDPHSSWGWPQNSLVTVLDSGEYRLNPEYYLLRHVSRFVRPGARCIPATSFTGYENQLAFANPDGSVVIVINNELSQDHKVVFRVGDRLLGIELDADSFSTIYLPAGTFSGS